MPDQIVGGIALLHSKLKTLVQLALAGCLFGHFVHTLIILTFEHIYFRTQLDLTALPGIFLVPDNLLSALKRTVIRIAANNLGHPNIQVTGKMRFPFLHFTFQTFNGQRIFNGFIDRIAEGGLGELIVQLGKHHVFLHNLAFMHQNGTQNAAFKILNGLGPLRAYHRAFSMRDLIQIRKSGPDSEHKKHKKDTEGKSSGSQTRPTHQRGINFIGVFDVVRGQSL